MWIVVALAYANTATFDAPVEGTTARLVVDDGITFTDLDNRLDPPPGVMTVEQANATLGGPGFTPNNVLGFGGYVPGADAAFGRFGQLKIIGPDGSDAASVELWDFGNAGVGLSLEAWAAGARVASTSAALNSFGGVQHTTLAIEGVPFDELRLVCLPANEACFMVIDTVRIGRLNPPADTGDTDVVETDGPDTDVVETDGPDTDVVETDGPDTDVMETDGPDDQVGGDDTDARDTPDTDPPDSDTPDSDVPDNATDGEDEEKATTGGCACDHGAAPSAAWLALGALAAARRRSSGPAR